MLCTHTSLDVPVELKCSDCSFTHSTAIRWNAMTSSGFAIAIELQSVTSSQFQFLGPTNMKMLQLVERNGTDAPAHFDQQMSGPTMGQRSSPQECRK